MKGKRNVGIAFFDIDGVLANCRHRLHYIEEGDKDGFYDDKNVLKDTLFDSGATLLRMFEDSGYKIIFTTSRRESCRRATLEWLDKKKLVKKYNAGLYMRSTGDYRKSWEVKKDLLVEAIENNEDLYLKGQNYFIDDYPKNCEMVEEYFRKSIKPILFGCARLNEDKGSYDKEIL